MLSSLVGVLFSVSDFLQLAFAFQLCFLLFQKVSV